MKLPIKSFLRHLFTTPYQAQPSLRTFLERSQTQQTDDAEVTVAVLDVHESEQIFGVPLARRGIQPVFLRITNRGNVPLRLQVFNIDPNYFTPLEAAGVNHFSLLKRLSAFGILGWFVLPLVFLLLPLKLLTAFWANRRIDTCFQALAFRLRPIEPGNSTEGFVFTRLDSGTKVVDICLHALGHVVQPPADAAPSEAVPNEATPTNPQPHLTAQPKIEFTFNIAVPGIAVDYHRRDFETLLAAEPPVECPNVATLSQHLRELPPTTTNQRGTGTGDPVNLVLIGDLEILIGAFVARWDETETITFATCWKTTKAFLLGSAYRYSPVSSLYLFGRSQDVALQRSRHSINERLHLRLWLTPLRFMGKPVWVGQVSRDIGVRFTTKTWNLTTHRIDPDVDEARDYVVEDLLEAERLSAAGYVDGVGKCDKLGLRKNLTGDSYFTDGKRAVVLISAARSTPKFVSWS